MNLFRRRQRDIPRWELAAAAYHLMLCTCRDCGTIHPTPEAAVHCEFADWQAVHDAEWELYRERTIPGYVHRDCGRCEQPLSDAEREHHMEAWRFYPVDQVGPALCHMCIDYLENEEAEREAVEAEMRADIAEVIAGPDNEEADAKVVEAQMRADIAEVIADLEQNEF